MQYSTYSQNDFRQVEKIDAHVHLNAEDARLVVNSMEDNFRLLTLNTEIINDFPTPHEQENLAIKISQKYPDRIFYAATFDTRNILEQGWTEETIESITASLNKGAVAVKVWKNIGLDLRDKKNRVIMIDDARFDAVFRFLEMNRIPVIGHLGEPKNCWLPLEKMTVLGDREYFSNHPHFHMFLHPEFPSYRRQINARDRRLRKNQGLQFVGAHLGSLEWSVKALAKRLDEFPNMAVDLAERISHLQYQSLKRWKEVRDFILYYQDRLIYGTDLIANGVKEGDAILESPREIRMRHWKFFTSTEMMKVPKVDGIFRGFELPCEVVDKIYRENAQKWIPGLRIQ